MHNKLNIIFALLSLSRVSFASSFGCRQANQEYVTTDDCLTPITLTLRTVAELSSCPRGHSPLQGHEIHPNFNTKKCLDVRGAVFANGTPVQIYDCNNSPAQRWFIRHESTIVQLAGTNFCLDAGPPSPKDHVGLKIWQCANKLPAQQWIYTLDNHRIALEETAFCVDLYAGDLTNGNPVETWTCVDGNPNQIWTINQPLFEAFQMQEIHGRP